MNKGVASIPSPRRGGWGGEVKESCYQHVSTMDKLVIVESLVGLLLDATRRSLSRLFTKFGTCPAAAASSSNECESQSEGVQQCSNAAVVSSCLLSCLILRLANVLFALHLPARVILSAADDSLSCFAVLV